MSLVRRALRYFRPDAARAACALGLLVLSTAAALLKPWPVAWIVDGVLGQGELPGWLERLSGSWAAGGLLALLALALFAIHAAQGVLTGAQNFLSIQIGLSGLRRLRIELFEKLQRLSLRFHQGQNAGDLIYRSSWDAYAFQTLFQQGIFTLATALLSLGLMLLIMYRLNPDLTAITAATAPLLLASMVFFGGRMRRHSDAAHKADSTVLSLVQQLIAALPVIQSQNAQPFEQERFTRKAAEARQSRLSQHGWEIAYGLSIALIFGGAAAGLTWVGAGQVLNGNLSVGELLVFLSYLAQLYEPLNQLSHMGATLADAGAGIHRVFEVLDSTEEIREAPHPVPLGIRGGTGERTVRGALSFEAVSFGYSPGSPVLQEIEFQLEPGQSLAVIGPSGAGKTTLLQLLPRFYDPDAGRVRLDGTDLRDARLADLRSHVALVMQEPILIAATVAENIAYGHSGARQEEIESAAKAAYADEFIRRLPRGYETVVGEGAARLSSGERQRISLARAFLKNAPILALDEPTSALDAESEAHVIASIQKLLRNRTTVTVAHRPSTIAAADRILVLADGRMSAYGTAAQLERESDYFARFIGRIGLK